MKTSAGGAGAQQGNASVAAAEVEKKNINVELWQTCAGPLVNMPAAGTHVVYFPQGHSEQVAASLKKQGDAQIPNYPTLPSKLLCILHNVTLHADPDTDEVYAQMTLQPVPSFDKEAVLRSELSMKVNKPHTEFFCKTLTASDTSTHGGFSVPRRAAEKIFPPLDFTMQPPAQEIVARDLHDHVWNFRHIYRGQPKRHLLTTGWSLFVSGKRLLAGDSVLFIRDEKQQLLVGIRRANRQPTNLSLSVLSTDSMHIGILAAAAHAAANNSPFTIFYNPRTSPSEFVIPLAKYYKAVYNYQISPGMRFRMLFETEESGTRRYMGTITGVNDLDPTGWKGSQWRNIQVGWDESVAGEKCDRVSIWEIEPVTAPFFICSTPPLFGSKRPRPPGMLDDDSSDFNSLFMRAMPWLGDDFGLKDAQAMPGLSLAQWMRMKQNPSLANLVQPNHMNSLAGSALSNLQGTDITHNLGLSAVQLPQQNNLPFSPQRPTTQAIQQLDHIQKLSSSPMNPSGSTLQSLQQLVDVTQPPRQSSLSQTTMPTSQVQPQILQSHSHIQAQNVLPQQHSLNHQLQRNFLPIMPQQQPQQPVLSHPQQHNPMLSQIPDRVNQQLHASQNQFPHQLLQNLNPHQQFLLAQQSAVPRPSQMNHAQDHPKQLFDIPANFPRSVCASQMQDATHAMPGQSNQKCGITSESSGNIGHSSRLINNQLSAGGSSLLPEAAACGVQPEVSDDAPSCSTSPSTNNCPNGAQSITNGRNQQTTMMRRDEIARFSATLSKNPSVMETLPSSSNLINDTLIKADVKPSLNTPKSQNQNSLGPQAYLNAPGAQMDCLDSSSSVTSVLSQNDAQVLPGNSSMPFNSQPMLFRDARQNRNAQDDPRSNTPFKSSIENQCGIPTTPQHLTTRRMGLGKDFPTDESCGGGMLSSYQNAQGIQPEPSSSMVSQSFGVPDMTFNSIDSTINDGSFMNTGAWAPPQIPRMRTYTKVYKRGAVGRSIDITSYSGYDDLKQDLARRFGIEGQLESRQKIGWKLVYVDHENDVLLVGDDPWEEFVNCVRCIKILSPQEVQQMSLDGDFGSTVPLNQACGSSEIIG